MRLLLLLAALAPFLTFVYANWSKEDYEIFDLVSAVENSEGKGVTFYDWLGVTDRATVAEITKAYKKKSLTLHPDKNGGTKEATERYARLGVVATILRNAERDRYDFWRKRGVPKWRGTGYYFSRYRPGVGTVLVFLTLVTAALQNMVHRMTYKSELERVRKFILLARKAAWGPKLLKNDGARKVRVNIAGNPNVDGEEQEFVPGRMVDMLVQGDEVFLLDGGERHILNENVPEKPTWSRTWPVSLVTWLVSLVQGKRAEVIVEQADVDEEESASSNEETVFEAVDDAKTVKATKPVAATKQAGGRRRKRQ